MIRRPPNPPLFPHTPLFRSENLHVETARLCYRAARQITAAETGRKSQIIFDARAQPRLPAGSFASKIIWDFLPRSEEHTSELQSPDHLVCRLLLEKKTIRST